MSAHTAMKSADHPACGVPPLPRGSMLRVQDGQETLVCVRNGCVWLTQERERRDIVLEAGQRFRITRSGATLMQALRDSEIDLLFARSAAGAQSVDLVLPGAARALPLYESRRGLRGGIAALAVRLTQAWLALYARPPRRAQPIV